MEDCRANAIEKQNYTELEHGYVGLFDRPRFERGPTISCAWPFSALYAASPEKSRKKLQTKTNPSKKITPLPICHCNPLLREILLLFPRRIGSLLLEHFSQISRHCSWILVMVAQEEEFTVDLNKPLVFQVGHLGEQYQEWVHQPIVSKEGPRFFGNNVLEFLTRTKWYAVPLIWLPVVFWLLTTSLRMGHRLSDVALMAALGILIWTLVEYVLHRFLFHINTNSYWANTAHYLLHGCHHKHPMDGLRLVFPPAATAILCIPFWNLVGLFTTASTTPAVFGGGLLGYVMYDCTHYYLHHGQPSHDPAKHLKKYHLNHHFRIQDKGFGITSSLWDIVFGTLPPQISAKKA
ncbi:Fatty acid 2-hydroxylase [Rhynchospora pubera]|uniref:Fatty acid 2-hydroxylase n=1 Tax=Rhynchospora pubera TaxID=906938 RepID=A0AAV8DUZ5_9POAL|nr:Fatty acid 2-hydroxylase [Rhynchospora pubera]